MTNPEGWLLGTFCLTRSKDRTQWHLTSGTIRNKPEGHEDKTYEYLMETMTRTIATEREEKNRLEKAKRGKIKSLQNPKALAAEKPGKKENQQENAKAAAKATNENAAPVVPRPPQKEHNEYAKGKGK